MDESTETSADAPRSPNGGGGTRSVFAPPLGDGRTGGGPAHLGGGEAAARRRHRWLLASLLGLLVLLVVLVIAWAIDTSSGGVARNVNLAGRDVGDISESELARTVEELADELAETPVEIHSDGRTYTTTASELGLRLDEDRTVRSVLDVDDETFLLLRPFQWVASFVTEREAEPHFQVSPQQASEALIELQGDDRRPPTEPSVELVDGEFRVVPGEAGRGIRPDELADRLPEAAAAWGEVDVLQVEIDPQPLPPLGSEAAAREAAERAESLVSEPLEVVTSAATRSVGPDVLRTWVRLASEDDGTVSVTLHEATVQASLRDHFRDIDAAPVDARFTLNSSGVPVIVPDEPGLVCCAPGSTVQVLEAMRTAERSVELDLVEGEALFRLADAQSWSITQAVGGNHAWRNGAPTTAGPGFTTYHAPGGARVTNIHRMADLVRGAVVPPGGRFSINDHVGRRTREKGFVAAGAIRNGMHVDEVGGGVSQFATTLFNAAYFAGLDIPKSQAHSEYFDRYPYGREATMGYPEPDLVLENNTPYGVMLWTSYTDSSLTVTLYSSPYATAEQTDLRESRAGNCRVVTTTRTRTYPDGRSERDTFTATYRPGEGVSC